MGFKDAVRAAGEDADDFDPPDGTHRCRLVDAGAFTARTSGRDKVKFVWQVIGTDYAGRRFDDFNDFDDSNPVGCRIVGEKLALLGLSLAELDPEDIEDLDHALFNVIGAQADVAVRHKDGFLNASIERVVTGQSDVTPPAPDTSFSAPEPEPASSGRDAFGAALGDDDIPF